MIKDKSIIAVIPARSGSKGLPGKNIKNLFGKPLIYWTIKAAQESKYIDKLIISTDSQEIASIGKKYNVDLPFLRPHVLSGDTTPSVDVIEHALLFFRDELKISYDFVMMLEPTSPLRTSQDIDLAIEKLFESSDAEALVGVCKTESQNPAFLAKMDEKNFISSYASNKFKIVRRQEVDDIYFFEGSIYLSRVPSFFKKRAFYHEKTIGFEFPKWKSIEIDDIYDFVMTEALMKYSGEFK